jgi:hypothetical protein
VGAAACDEAVAPPATAQATRRESSAVCICRDSLLFADSGKPRRR